MKNKVKQFLSLSLIAVTLVSSFDLTAFAKEDSISSNTVVETDSIQTFSNEIETSNNTTLILSGEDANTFLEKADEVVSFDSFYVLSFNSNSTCDNVYNEIKSSGLNVSVERNETVTIETDDTSSIYNESFLTELGYSANDSDYHAFLNEEDTNEVIVAIIDTGINKNNIDTNRVIETNSYNFIDDNNDITDKNGHGTYMSQILLNYTPDNVKVLPLKAANDSGTGTVLSVYLAIEKAIEENVDVINISLSNEGQSPILEKAINDAYNANIPVVVSAGNNASDATGYMPGNIDKAITISSVEDDKSLSSYSNYGNVIDYTSYGNAKIINEEGNEQIISGTSVSAVYATISYSLINCYQKELTVDEQTSYINNNVCVLPLNDSINAFGQGLINLKDFSFENNPTEKDEDVAGDNGDSSIVDDENQELNTSAVYKTKSFYIYAVYGCTAFQVLAKRDRDGANIGLWNGQGLGSINVSYAGNNAYRVDEVSINVTSYTPYISFKNDGSRTGYTMSGMIGGSVGGNGCSSGFTAKDTWANSWNPANALLYIGAGFSYNDVTITWSPNLYAQTLNHYKLKNGSWVLFATTYENAYYDSVYVPSYTTAPTGYYAYSRTEETGRTVAGDRTFSLYYHPHLYTQTIIHQKYQNGAWVYFTTTYANAYYDTIFTPAYTTAPTGYHAYSRTWNTGWAVAGAGTFYAYYYPNTYTITYNGNTGTPSVASKTALYDCPWGTLATATKRGYDFMGWYTAPEGGTLVTKNTICKGNLTVYAHWQIISGTVTINGNGATTEAGETSYVLGEYTSFDEVTYPDNIFGTYNTESSYMSKDTTTSYIQKIDTWTYANEDNVLHSFRGWSVDPNANSNYSASIIQEPQAVEQFLDILETFNGFKSLTADMLAADASDRTLSVLNKADTYEKSAVIPTDGREVQLYAVWDEYPTLSVKDHYLTLNQAKLGYVTESYLLNTVKATDKETETFELATRDEDGNVVSLKDGSPLENSYILVYDYSLQDFTSLTQEAIVSVTYEAVDNVGNATLKRANVYCVDTKPIEQLDFKFTRFISDKYYGLPEKEGGLNENSIWMTNPEYIAQLSNALAEDASPEEVWVFTNEDKKAVKQYIDTHGIGNVEDENALRNFVDKFSHCKQ